MATNQQFCLRWNNHQRTLISVFDSLLESGTLVDCTLAAEGQFLKAHKVVLSACSPYLGVLLSQHHEKHPILILKDIRFQELKAMLDYMYRGEVNITQEHLCTFLKAAESLQIKGLTESAGIQPDTKEYEERVTKRTYDRKSGSSNAHNHNVRNRSPVTPDSVWNQKFPSQGFRSTTPPIVRDGSTSPSSRKRRKQQHPLPNCDESVSSNSGENSQESNVNDSLCVQETITPTNNTGNTSFLAMNNFKSDLIEKITCEVDGKNIENKSGNGNNKSVDIFGSINVKAEIIDDKDCGEQSYEDSVEELTVEDEEEDMIDENDMSKAGPSNSDDGQSYGMGPFHASCENSEGVNAGQMDCQGMKSWKLHYLSNWESWSAAHPSVPPLQGASAGLSPHSSSNTINFDYPKGVECPDCGRHYKLKSSLRNHQKWECGKEPQFQCPYCTYRAKQKMHVARHIERMHREKLAMMESFTINNNNNINSNNNSSNSNNNSNA